MNLDAVNQATTQATAAGLRVLNAFMAAPTEAEHVKILTELLDAPHGATVLDAGCGIGEVARLMHEARPDLKFTLLNVSQEQLDQCPEGMPRICADFAAVPLPAGSMDVVMFNYAISHAPDWLPVLKEAARLLKPGGVLFINDMLREGGSNLLMAQLVQAWAQDPFRVLAQARQAGFDLHQFHSYEPRAQRLRDAFGSTDLYDLAFDSVKPAFLRFTRVVIDDPIESAFHRHERIAFQFSGGRDSTAALYALRPYWSRMVIYHLDTGDHFPETMAVVETVAREVPIVRIHSDVAAVRLEHGLPSDLVPVDNTPVGQKVSGRELRLQGRYECCWRALMAPMHQRMIDDGITLIVRGQRDDEYAAPPLRSGDTEGAFEVLYPIQSWSAELVDAYLMENYLPLAPFYARGMKRAPECMGCTAWWDEGRGDYLRDYHPIAFQAYTVRMAAVRQEIDRQLGALDA